MIYKPATLFKMHCLICMCFFLYEYGNGMSCNTCWRYQRGKQKPYIE